MTVNSFSTFLKMISYIHSINSEDTLAPDSTGTTYRPKSFNVF